MIEQKKKLRLDELKVDSFVTSVDFDAETIQGGTYFDTRCGCGVTPVTDGPGAGSNQCGDPPYVTNGHCPGQTDYTCNTYGLICLTRQAWCGIPTIADNCFTADPNKKCNDFT